MGIGRKWTAILLLAGASPAAAEVLTIRGSNPPVRPVADDLASLSVERFAGPDGAALSDAIEAELGSATFGGRPYFRIVAPEAGGPADGLITGTVRTGVEETPVTEKRTRCEEKDPNDDKKCLKEVQVDIRCRRRVATVNTSIRLVAMGDGSVRYTRPQSLRDEQTLCPDRKAGRSVEEFVAAALANEASGVRFDLAPAGYAIDVRVDENRKGLSKPAQDAFRAAVRQTKSDEAGACASWSAIARDVEPTAALAFNLGLCAEMQQNFDAAIDWYGQAQRLGSKSREIPAALARIERHRAVLAAWQARKRLMGYE